MSFPHNKLLLPIILIVTHINYIEPSSFSVMQLPTNNAYFCFFAIFAYLCICIPLHRRVPLFFMLFNKCAQRSIKLYETRTKCGNKCFSTFSLSFTLSSLSLFSVLLHYLKVNTEYQRAMVKLNLIIKGDAISREN